MEISPSIQPTPVQDPPRLPVVATQPVLDVPLALTDYAGTLDWIDQAVATGAREYICVAAVHTVMACQDDPALRAAVTGASFTVPDGQPLVWALRALGHPLGDRVYGPELMERACARAARTGQRMYLYGGRNQGALAQLTRTLRLRHSGLKIVGGYAPPFRALTDAEEERIAYDIDRSGADVVWVGIGVPKQEKWMARMRPRLRAPVLVGVGAAFDFHAGLVPQAPPAMQRHGLEWLFRCWQEPRRLWRRYARYNPRFVIGFARQYARHRLGR
jgi:N-acetylglucosaminyldiphosphoundecaprenol N-acetyl-beta-D-mannosaminyltransferase